MSAKREENGTWTARFRLKDRQGNVKEITRRGHATKREALETEARMKLQNNPDMDTTFAAFYEIYESDLENRLGTGTRHNKHCRNMARILPFFGKMKMNEIKPSDYLHWQNEMIAFTKSDGKHYSQTYLRALDSGFRAVMNHAERLYDLHPNPIHRVSCMGSSKTENEMLFWVKEEYQSFAKVAKEEDPVYFLAFEILYWGGLREGELLALTAEDISLKDKTIRINKTLYKVEGETIIDTPKTDKSNRVIRIPNFLCTELEEFMNRQYGLLPTDRILPLSKNQLLSRMTTYSGQAGVKRIRIHDLRHSHISLLIDMGFTAVDIGNRVGHESEKITYRYAHMFPSKQDEMMQRLQEVKEAGYEPEEFR